VSNRNVQLILRAVESKNPSICNSIVGGIKGVLPPASSADDYGVDITRTDQSSRSEAEAKTDCRNLVGRLNP